MNAYQNHLKVTVCEDATDAIRHGFLYRAPVFLPIQVDQAVLVKKGTLEQKATVDLVMVDEKGQKYVCMMTAALLATLLHAEKMEL